MASVLAIVSGHTAFPVMFKSIDVGDTYFRSVSIGTHECPELLALHQHITNELKKLEAVEPRSPRFPHMSLYYIDDSEPDERQMIVDELLRSKRVVKEGNDRIILECRTDKHQAGKELLGFDSDAIWIVNCEGPVEQWKVLEGIGLLRS